MAVIPPGLKTEPITYRRMGSSPGRAGEPIPAVVLSIGPRPELLRPCPASKVSPKIDAAGLTRTEQYYCLWFDEPLGEGLVVDPTWTLLWSPTDGSPARTLRPVAQQEYCPVNALWRVFLVQVV